MTEGKVDENLLKEIIRRIVDAAHPSKIILFGSAARDQLGPDSDLDILVVKSGVEHRREMAAKIHKTFRGLEVSADIIVATPEDLEDYKDIHSDVISHALKEGRVIYDAA